MVDATTFLSVCRPKGFGDILGQDELVATLRGRLTHPDGQAGHVILAGTSGSGKMTVARMYAQASRCREKGEDGSPCQCCPECRGVLEKSAFGYIELDASELGDEARIQQLVKAKDGLSTAEWRVFVIDNAECLEPAAAEVMLKTLESVRGTIFIFAVNDIAKFPFAVRSRCQVFQVRPSERGALVDRLKKVCVQESIAYEEQAIEALVKLAGGRVGVAFRRLAKMAGHGDVTLSAVMKVLGLGWGELMLQCWTALLANRVEEALSSFEQVASDDEGRIRAMQSFLLAMHFRNSSGTLRVGGVSPALEYLTDESWRPVILGFENLARRRSVPVDGLVASVMRFWAGVRMGTPARLSFMKGCEVVLGTRLRLLGTGHQMNLLVAT